MNQMQQQGSTARPGTVVVLHFFSERTDGVSLEIQENDRVLVERGWNVIECSADASGNNGFVIPELDYSMPQVLAFKKRDSDDPQHDAAMETAFENMVQAIKGQLAQLIQQAHPQVFHLRNVLSLPIHPVATVAVAECIAEHPEVGFLAQHHDFSFEVDFVPGDRQKAYTLPYPNIQQRVEKALLFSPPNVHHAVINSLMQKHLLAAFGIHAAIIPDAFDFETRPIEIADLREKLGIHPNDVVVGAMARIIPRKAMEVAAQFIAALRTRKGEFLGAERGVYGRTIDDDTRFLLLLPQAAGLDEPSNAAYFNKLRDYATSHGVEVLYIGDRVVADSVYRGEPDRFPFYSLYHAVDMIAFPSYQEGFGNQFLEAVALGKGVVAAHAYPVMEADILPRITQEGIVYLGTNDKYTLGADGLVSLQEDVLQAAVDKEIAFLLHPEQELSVATITRQRLKEAFDAKVIGNHISDLLLGALPIQR